MDAIFNVLKPPQMTSHDVIGFLRRMLNTKKIGHGGTLDPDAAGVLPVFAGSATRLLEFAVEGRKEYIAEFTLGAQTVTGDDSGEVVKTMPVPAFGKQELEAVLAQFTGKQLQLPPMYSAVKINGQPLYKAARKGQTLERTPRPITIYEITYLGSPAPGDYTIRVSCSKGTYIRTLCHDIGRALGCPPHWRHCAAPAPGRSRLRNAIPCRKSWPLPKQVPCSKVDGCCRWNTCLPRCLP